MPLYVFHIENGHVVSGDKEECRDDQAALQIAQEIARDLSKSQRGGRSRVVATNEAGARVAEVEIVSNGT
jgi:hypothetical protein